MRIYRMDYPFLEDILWDTRKCEFSGEELLYYIERRFGYIDYNTLDSHEIDLIAMLVRDYGNGILLHS